jgi:hypothetical protein
MMIKTTHYTNLGVSMQPSVADQEGYIEYRDGYESLPREDWTDAEEWLCEQEERIARFQSR